MAQVGKEVLERYNCFQGIVADMLGVGDTLPVVGRQVVGDMQVVAGRLVEVGMLVEVGILVVVEDHTRQRSGAVEGRVEDSRVLGSGVHHLSHHLSRPLILL